MYKWENVSTPHIGAGVETFFNMCGRSRSDVRFLCDACHHLAPYSFVE